MSRRDNVEIGTIAAMMLGSSVAGGAIAYNFVPYTVDCPPNENDYLQHCYNHLGTTAAGAGIGLAVGWIIAKGLLHICFNWWDNRELWTQNQLNERMPLIPSVVSSPPAPVSELMQLSIFSPQVPRIQSNNAESQVEMSPML